MSLKVTSYVIIDCRQFITVKTPLQLLLESTTVRLCATTPYKINGGNTLNRSRLTLLLGISDLSAKCQLNRSSTLSMNQWQWDRHHIIFIIVEIWWDYYYVWLVLKLKLLTNKLKLKKNSFSNITLYSKIMFKCTYIIAFTKIY